MRYLLSVILIALFSFLLSLYMSWWSIAVVAFCVNLWLVQKPVWAFVSGFVSILLLWGGLAWYISSANNDILAHKLSQLVLQKDSPALLIGVTALSGALVAGFAALSGALLGRLIFEKKPEAEG
ncbi:MAG: hypothetical protein KIT80_17760 [Chitinophagaceae bacterium]|nr:hypothetical protein [Chitinophagaceae bacterium]MCW5928771.1 hypothetical protein [Chitinophagaceae bacterium]